MDRRRFLAALLSAPLVRAEPVPPLHVLRVRCRVDPDAVEKIREFMATCAGEWRPVRFA